MIILKNRLNLLAVPGVCMVRDFAGMVNPMLKKILIVDDEESMRLLYTRVFSVAEYSFTLAASLAEARALVNAASYDILITDLILKDGHGTELIELARGKDAGTKAIIVSGAIGPLEMLVYSEKYRLSGCFCKPFNIKALLRAVKNGTD